MPMLSHSWSRTHSLLQGSIQLWHGLGCEHFSAFIEVFSSLPPRYPLIYTNPVSFCWLSLRLFQASGNPVPSHSFLKTGEKKKVFPTAYKNVILKTLLAKVISVEHLEVNAEPCCWFHPVQAHNYQQSWCCSAGKQCFKHNLLRSNRDQANRCPLSSTKTQILFRGKLANTGAAWIQFIKVPEKATMKKGDKQSSERTIADQLWHNQETGFSRMDKGDARPFSH